MQRLNSNSLARGYYCTLKGGTVSNRIFIELMNGAVDIIAEHNHELHENVFTYEYIEENSASQKVSRSDPLGESFAEAEPLSPTVQTQNLHASLVPVQPAIISHQLGGVCANYGALR
jgi:hypothetical protein